jgi:hypothetical protein
VRRQGRIAICYAWRRMLEVHPQRKPSPSLIRRKAVGTAKKVMTATDRHDESGGEIAVDALSNQAVVAVVAVVLPPWFRPSGCAPPVSPVQRSYHLIHTDN